MRKMKLDMEKLAVESFAVAEDTDARGTIAGNEATERVICTRQTCMDTCEYSCDGSCYTYPMCQQVC